MPSAVSSGFAAGVGNVSTNISDLLGANLAAILGVAAILIAVGVVWRFTRRAVGSRIYTAPVLLGFVPRELVPFALVAVVAFFGLELVDAVRRSFSRVTGKPGSYI